MSRINDPIERARRNPRSLRAAIDAMCWDCQGRDADPAPRWRIGNCVCPDCPLYPLRPYQNRFGAPVPTRLRGIAANGETGAEAARGYDSEPIDTQGGRGGPPVRTDRDSQRVAA